MISLEHISKRCAGALALDDVTLSLQPGERLGLIGENGAGKSSLMNVLYGLYQPDSGVVRFDGQAVELKSPRQALARGIGMVQQHFTLVPTLSVAENVVLGAEPLRSGLIDHPRAEREVEETCARFGFKLDVRARVSTLSVGSQQKVEIVKALHRGATTLILDEPTAVLTPQEALELFAVTRALSDAGKSVVLISHKLREVLAFATRIVVMRRGKKVADDLRPELTSPEALAALMVGAEPGLGGGQAGASAQTSSPNAGLRGAKTLVDEVTASSSGVSAGPGGAKAVPDAGPGAKATIALDDATAQRRQSVHEPSGLSSSGEVRSGSAPIGASSRTAGEVVLSIQNLRGPGLHGVTLEVRAGEIVGIAGVDGNGQRELAETVTGLARFLEGTITLGGHTLRSLTPARARTLGVAHIPEDRQRRAMVGDFSVEENVALGRQGDPPFARGPFIDFAGRRARTEQLLEAHDVRPRLPQKRMAELSGGNQQKLVVARELDTAPKLLVVVQPTRGLDIAAVEAVRGHLRRVRDSGCAVLLVSLDRDEVLALADRVLVMFEGRLNGEFARGAVEELELGRRMLGANA